MIGLNSVSKEISPFETMEPEPAAQATTGSSGSATAEASRSARHLLASGKSGPLRPPFETVIGIDERVRILDTDLAPWRMICALRMRGSSGAGAIGTGWFIGPRTVLTAGHCVFSNYFFGGWASTIEVIPGLNGSGDPSITRPYGSVSSDRFSSIDRWTQNEDADFDIGCIHLREPLGEQIGWFAVGAPPPEQLESFLVNVSGYPGDRGAGAEQYHGRNRVVRVTERRLFYEIDTYGGQSAGVDPREGGLPAAGRRHSRLRGRRHAGVAQRHRQFGAEDHPRGARAADRMGRGGRRLAEGVTTLSELAGRVVDGDGAPVPQARIVIVAGSVPVPEIALLADDDGRFHLRLPAGVFTLQAHGSAGRGRAEVKTPSPDDDVLITVR